MMQSSPRILPSPAIFAAGYPLADAAGFRQHFSGFLEGNAALAPLVEFVAGCSPYLHQLLLQNSDIIDEFARQRPAVIWKEWLEIFRQTPLSEDKAEEMARLRQFKRRATLLFALADAAQLWPLEEVTQSLAALADATLQRALDFQLQHYRNHKGLTLAEGVTAQACGLVILGMGKLGAQELNYSSDVDLILLYDPQKLEYTGRQSLAICLNRFTQDVIAMMEERTRDGYVFRMDFRLRPDPHSTPLAVCYGAAMRYYESVGQNWERAAFIKARPVAGDIALGCEFLDNLIPFIWRKSLDYAAIADIQSIKRQMQHHHEMPKHFAGYHLKKGIGGIREIEFLAQLHQLIWGGRDVSLRAPSTVEALKVLTRKGLLSEEETTQLIAHYRQLRHIEHRLQLLYDEQTHTVPESVEALERLWRFAGYASEAALMDDLRQMAAINHRIYHQCFEETPSLASSGKLAFTGVGDDKETIETLEAMGFADATTVYRTLQQWHHGSLRAMRSARARELLTELTPVLLKTFAANGEGDENFARFSKFFQQLPAGVVFLSTLHNNPVLLDLLVAILSTAPKLAEQLSKHPDWFDAVLQLGNQPQLLAEESHISPHPLFSPDHYQNQRRHSESPLDWLCRYRTENEFILGCQIIARQRRVSSISAPLSEMAEISLQTLLPSISKEFAQRYGMIEGGSFAVVALGRLASREMVFGSDLDLLFLYDAPSGSLGSNGDKSLSAAVYYNRLAQRIVGQLTSQTAEGRLYEVDTRLRPTGEDGPLAVSLDGLRQYYAQSAWGYEIYALLRHRVVAVEPAEAIRKPAQHFQQALGEILLEATARERHFAAELLPIRREIYQQHKPANGWQVKLAPGGLMDITLLAQHLTLRAMHQNAMLLPASVNPPDALREAARLGLIGGQESQDLRRAYHQQLQLQALLRLSHSDFQPHHANPTLRSLLAEAMECSSLSEAELALAKMQEKSYRLFTEVIGDYTA